jgi:hypothetical protein
LARTLQVSAWVEDPSFTIAIIVSYFAWSGGIHDERAPLTINSRIKRPSIVCDLDRLAPVSTLVVLATLALGNYFSTCVFCSASIFFCFTLSLAKFVHILFSFDLILIPKFYQGELRESISIGK